VGCPQHQQRRRRQGFPCQDLSVAGQRKGLAGNRSGLFFEYARIAESLRPRWLLVENVPGLLSSNGGRDFGTVVGTLADVGYGMAWRVLDSRFFGVPQRRRRVFIVGALAHGDPRAAAERAGQILAVGTRCPRHPATRSETGTDVAGSLTTGSGGGRYDKQPHVASLSGLGTGGPDDNDGQAGRVIAFHNTQTPISDDNVSLPIGRKTFGMGVAISENQRGELLETDYAHQLTSGGGKPGQGYPAVREGASVRRLMPVECERLQALPDQWTNLGDTADSKRYAALGDAVTASVAEWIGRRLANA
jgi:DNA (cytosine-5)-methyltransferase 1